LKHREKKKNVGKTPQKRAQKDKMGPGVKKEAASRAGSTRSHNRGGSESLLKGEKVSMKNNTQKGSTNGRLEWKVICGTRSTAMQGGIP